MPVLAQGADKALAGSDQISAKGDNEDDGGRGIAVKANATGQLAPNNNNDKHSAGMQSRGPLELPTSRASNRVSQVPWCSILISHNFKRRKA